MAQQGVIPMQHRLSLQAPSFGLSFVGGTRLSGGCGVREIGDLRRATRVIGELEGLGLADRGVLKVGARADLVLLKRNPLAGGLAWR